MKELPKGALRFVETDEQCCAMAVAEGDKPPKFKMKAYSGGVIKGHWYWNNLAIDLQGMSFKGSKFPILEDHRTDRKIAFTGKPIISEAGLDINPNTTKFIDTPESLAFQKASQEGFPFQASIYAKPSSVERVMEGEKAEVNGMTVKGPASIWRKCEFKEASVCVFGWDSETQSSAFSRTETEVVDDYTEIGKEETEEEGKKLSNNKLKKEVKTMDLAQFKIDHPELVTQFTDEITASLTETFNAEKAVLEASIAEKDQKLSDQEDRVLKLEKKEIIRHEGELKNMADSIWTRKLSESDVSEHLFSKVRAMVSHTKFVKDGVFDAEKFGEAVDAEIKDFEDLGATTTVMGTGFNERTVDSEAKTAEKLAQEDDETHKDLARLAGREVE